MNMTGGGGLVVAAWWWRLWGLTTMSPKKAKDDHKSSRVLVRLQVVIWGELNPAKTNSICRYYFLF